MKKIAIPFWICLICGLIPSCITPIDVDVRELNQGLVVSGGISTILEKQSIRLQKSTEFDPGEFPSSVLGANVWVSDDQGNRFDFEEIQNKPGYYFSNTEIRGEVGRSYVLHIETPEGSSYESNPELIRPVGSIDTIFTEPVIEEDPEEGTVVRKLNILLNGRDLDVSDEYYRWTWTHYRVNAHCRIQESIFFGVKQLIGTYCCENPCFDISRCRFNCINLASDALFSGRKISRILIDQVPICPEDYYIEVRQQSLSQGAYDFWRTVERLTQNTGSAFDATPAKVRGNIRCINKPEEEVYGYFEAVDIVEKGLFLDRNISGPYTVKIECPLAPDNSETFGCFPCEESTLRTTQIPKYWK